MELLVFPLRTWQDQETFYQQVVTACYQHPGGPLCLNLRLLPFIPAERVLSLVSVARWWHRKTGYKTRLLQMQQQVHQYLERADLFIRCADWLEEDHTLALEERFERSPESLRLLEILPIRGDKMGNAQDVPLALKRAKAILTHWLDQDSVAVERLCTMLAELASNIVHSQDSGFAIIQRYRDSGYYPNGSRVHLAIADLGIGIEASLRGAAHRKPLAAAAKGTDYIQYALQFGSTSRGSVAGTGLPMVKTHVQNWSGTLEIRSDRSRLICWGEECIHNER
jgi:hypothetical protein